jgi:hypothetical protein
MKLEAARGLMADVIAERRFGVRKAKATINANFGASIYDPFGEEVYKNPSCVG